MTDESAVAETLRPRRRRGRGTVNTVLLFSILAFNTMHFTLLGGPGTIWNTLSFAAAAVLAARTITRPASYAGVFAIPVVFVCLSMVANLRIVRVGTINTALATIVGFIMFACPPRDLNRPLLRRLVLLYLASVFLTAIGYFLADPTVALNMAFTVNPNTAAELFYAGGVLALFFVTSRFKWVIVAVCALLLVTTQSRTGNAAFALSVILYVLLGDTARMPGLVKILFRVLKFVPVVVVVLVVVETSFAEYSAALMGRFGETRHYSDLSRSRFSLWFEGIRITMDSPKSILFGHGPATISELLGQGSNSSFIEAVGSFGMLFLMASLFAMVVWGYTMMRERRHALLSVLLPLLMYGVTETFLFSGLSMLWFLLAFIGAYEQADAVPYRRRRRRRVAAGSPETVPTFAPGTAS